MRFPGRERQPNQLTKGSEKDSDAFVGKIHGHRKAYGHHKDTQTAQRHTGSTKQPMHPTDTWAVYQQSIVQTNVQTDTLHKPNGMKANPSQSNN